MKFFKRKPKGRSLPVTPAVKQKLAEQVLSDKINKLADWLEQQKDWNLSDAYMVMGFIMKQSLAPQLGNKKELLDKAIEAIFIKEDISEEPLDPLKGIIAINRKEDDKND